MIEKQWYYYISDEENPKLYFADEEQFLEYLRENDTVTCGAELLSDLEFEKLQQENGDL